MRAASTSLVNSAYGKKARQGSLGHSKHEWSWEVFVDDNVVLLVEDADVHGSGVEIDAEHRIGGLGSCRNASGASVGMGSGLSPGRGCTVTRAETSTLGTVPLPLDCEPVYHLGQDRPIPIEDMMTIWGSAADRGWRIRLARG